MKRVLLLGGSGFIGKAIARELAEQGQFQVTLGPRQSELNLATARYYDWDKLLEIVPDVIINAAGCTFGSDEELFQGNTLLVSRLLLNLERLKLMPWLVHLGSAAEYGATPSGLPVSEYAVPRPLNTYGVNKLSGTWRFLDTCQLGRAQGVVLRIFNPVGAGQGLQTLPGRAAALLRAACQEGANSVHFGPLGASRDYVHLRDVAQAVSFAADLSRSPPLLNVGSGQAQVSRLIVTELAKLAGFKGEIIESAAPSSRSQILQSQQADISRIREMGWWPKLPLHSALQELWESGVTAHWPQGIKEWSHDTPHR